MTSPVELTDRGFWYPDPGAPYWGTEERAGAGESQSQSVLSGYIMRGALYSNYVTRILDLLEENRRVPPIETWDLVDRHFDWRDAWIHPVDVASSTENLRQRLANANDFFRRKASEVFNDKEALRLLEALYQEVVVDIADLDWCEYGVSLARLTAANFCEAGAKVIYITDAGQRFIDSLRAHGQV